MVDEDRTISSSEHEVIVVWNRKSPVVIAVAVLLVFLVFAVNFARGNANVTAEVVMIAQLPLLAIVFTLILSVRSVFLEPAAFFDPQAKMLTTINRFGVERRWPRYRGEGELAAETGGILFLDDRGRKRVVLTRFEVNPAQFELVRNAIVAVEGVGKAGGRHQSGPAIASVEPHERPD